ncbi:MAG: shikimate dehydrogenase [Desulfobulbus sp.]|nr:MAG: shikimate dehydrogenase [Desulfobulbus sp.]
MHYVNSLKRWKVKINGSSTLHGIIGNPVHHSLSPAMHNAAFVAMGKNSLYVPMRVEHVAEAIDGLAALGFVGVSVTVPHKETVMQYLDEIDPVAEKIGAVNTILFRSHPENSQRVSRGFNTDWLGSNMALAEVMKLPGGRVLVLGAGGAAKAVGFGLVEAGAEVIITNRSEERGRELAHWLGCGFCLPGDLGSITGTAIVNTTSVGMVPDISALPCDPALLRNFSVAMDIVYAPLETAFLREATSSGCTTVDGLTMLLYQGVAQWKIWTGEQPPRDVMRAALLKELQGR